jgi:hypothetical protein
MSSPWVILLCPIMCLYVLLSYISVQHILCCIFVLSFFVLCTLCYQFLWIVHFWRHFRYSLTFIIYVYILTYAWPYVAGVGEFSLLIKSPNKVWRLIVFASFLIIIIIIIIIIIYYYYSSSSSRRELVRPNSQRLMFRSLLNFTGRWILISRGAIRSWNFQNGRRWHGNREHMSKSLTSLISETAIYIIY